MSGDHATAISEPVSPGGRTTMPPHGSRWLIGVEGNAHSSTPPAGYRGAIGKGRPRGEESCLLPQHGTDWRK
jgi:hypothetical protein